MLNKINLFKATRIGILRWWKIILMSLLVLWLLILCIVPNQDTFYAKCTSTKVDDWSYAEGEGLIIKFQGYDKMYNVKVTDKEFDLDRMVKNNILDRNTCKVLSNKVK